MRLEQAIRKFVTPGMHLHFGSTPSRSNAAVRELARAFAGRKPGFTISATGVVVPEVEQVITSPVEARVLRVIERAGAKLTAGQPILQLDD